MSPSETQPIYLDHAAATPLRPEVVEAMRQAEGAFGNPSSPHAAGRRAKRLLEEARERILAAVGAVTAATPQDRLVFTSGATEANRLAILGLATAGVGRLAYSARDHASVAAAARWLGEQGWAVEELPLDEAGSVAAGLARFYDHSHGDRPAIVCLTPVCGQTGIRDWPTIGPTRPSGLVVHVDATQAIGWEPLSFQTCGAATLTVAAHKIGGPRGIGGLLLRGGITIAPQTPGPQELGFRGGTEAVPLAVGFATAVELLAWERASLVDRVGRLHDQFERFVLAAATRHGVVAHVVGDAADRSPHVSTIAFAGIDRQSLVMAADLAGVCLSTGTACASGSSDPAPAVAAMNLPPWVPQAAVRASFGRTTTPDDIAQAAARLDEVLRRLAMLRAGR
ncbi:MAG: cysteine desulfurase family protein [Pirellulales bacterium]